MQTVPWPKHFSFFKLSGAPVVALQTKKLRKRITLVDQLPCVLIPASYLLYKFQDPFSACRQSHAQNRFFLLQFLERTNLYFTDHETQEENELGGPPPLWGSTYTSYLFYKVHDPFSTCRQSHGQNRFFLL